MTLPIASHPSARRPSGNHLLPKWARIILPLSLSCLLTACAATGPDLQPQPVPVAAPTQTSKTPQAHYDKDQKLLKEGKMVNDYVNSNVPSQVRYSIGVLNAAPADTGDYPAIEDLSEPNNTLRSEEERKKIEEELLLLNKKRN